MIRIGTDAFGTVGGQTATGGVSSIGTPTITNLGGAISNIREGDYVIPSAGFAPDKGSFRVLSKVGNVLTLDDNAISSETGVSVISQAGLYTDGIKDLVARSVLLSKYINVLQEEMCNAVEAAGRTLDASDKKQLAKSIGVSGFQEISGFNSSSFVRTIPLRYLSSFSMATWAFQSYKLGAFGNPAGKVIRMKANLLVNGGGSSAGFGHCQGTIWGNMGASNVCQGYTMETAFGETGDNMAGMNKNFFWDTTSNVSGKNGNLIYMDGAGDLWYRPAYARVSGESLVIMVELYIA